MSSLSSYYSGVSGTATAVRHQSLETLWGLPAGSVQLWQSGNAVTSPEQIRVFTDGLAYNAPKATTTNPIMMSVNPVGSGDWGVFKANVNANLAIDDGFLDEPVSYIVDDGLII